MVGRVLVNLEETKHIAIIGEIGYGKTTYARDLVEQALKVNPALQVYVFGARGNQWEGLSTIDAVTLFSMEETIKQRLLEQTYLDKTKDTLVVVDDIGHTLQMLPMEEHMRVISGLHTLLTQENVTSIITSFRPIKGYYPKTILELANTRIALKLEHEADYVSFFGTKAYKDNPTFPEETGEAFIDTKTTKSPLYIKTVQEVELV